MMKFFPVVAIFLFLISGCNRTVPSSHEVHYCKGLSDSIVFVNYNVSSDVSHNFYMDYKLFMKHFKKNNYENVYKYHCSYPNDTDTIDYTTYRRKEFYFNNNPDDAEYYQSNSSTKKQNENSSLKPSNSYVRPTRPYTYKK